MATPDFDRLSALPLSAWTPRTSLVSRQTSVPRSAVPSIDIHNHLGRWLSADGDWMASDVPALVATMDEHGVEAIVNLDGMWGEELSANIARYDESHPGRFFTFCQLDWALLAQPDGADLLRESLRDSVQRGARGVKIWKSLGLHVIDETHRLVLPSDSRVVDIVSLAGQLGVPVLIHTADPRAFFEPLDEHNERLEELVGAPDWWFGDRERFPTFEQLLDAHGELVLACPGTRIIGAHAGCAAEDLDRVERLLATAPNYLIDIAGRMAELGRQPRRTRALIDRFPDRVLFGTDVYPVISSQLELHFRFLETADEGFDYAPEDSVPPQGRWTVSGLDLTREQLAAIYHDNAARALGLSES